jgi:two-component system OmpR family response regulator
MRVLIVDDDPNCRQILELMLARQGWSLHFADNGVEGLRQARALRPDLILMDVLMPQMSGLDVVRHLKAEAGLDHVPVFAITALAFDEERRAAYSAGFDLVITKPFSRRQLLEAVRSQFPGLEDPPQPSRVSA